FQKGCRSTLHFPDDVLLSVMAGLDEETVAHSRRVEALVLAIGQSMGLTAAELDALRIGASVHDVGKQLIPETILKKKEPLTPMEWAIIETHPQLGYELVQPLGLSDAVTEIVLGHHLWANGQGGYPLNGKLKTPSLLAQITTVADVVDAMTSHRAYRPALNPAACLEYLEANAGTRFNEDVVEVFKRKIYPNYRKSG
ncbi:MAG TPA: HD domain-containing protein, partial [Limnochordia bacterium]|nr:HD domain-containing protein [Limnochordia bacterium]HOK31917.1 HD domain-containing protein [Limnochordia bacterium]